MNSRKKKRGGKYTRIRPFMPLPGYKTDQAAADGADAADAARESAEQPAGTREGEPSYAELKAERDSYLDLARRERADFDNYRKRVEREAANMKRASLGCFLKDFFGPLDDLDRVIAESGKTQSYETLEAGVRIMEEKFWRALANAGVTRMDAKGKPFDPGQHEAIAAVPSADTPPNTVLEVYEHGYKLDDFILRPARVAVSREA